ncbi:polyketide synthase dehydratase domain-containing protein, partial [Nocardia noduli]|uniref:polyketide synthase dehydratase domain-containing protein n=1 Tax=Nocardia noduli TaxID=2815722 RepID=UPI001C233F2F
ASLLHKDRVEDTTLLSALAVVDVSGVGVDWTPVFDGRSASRVPLPSYAFQHRRYWLDTVTASGDPDSLGLSGLDHPLIGAVVVSPETGGVTVTGRLSLQTHPWLADHAVGGVVLLPGTGLVELVIRAGDEVGCGVVRELTLVAPLTLPAEGGTALQVLVGALETSGTRTVSVYSQTRDQEWVLNAQGLLQTQSSVETLTSTTPVDTRLAAWPPAGAAHADTGSLYEQLAETGYGYGPAFQGLQSVWRAEQDWLVQATLPATAGEAKHYGLHPALLDSVLHAMTTGHDTETGTGAGPLLPFTWEDVQLHAVGASTVHARITPHGHNTVRVTVTDPDGQPVLTIGSLTLRPAQLDQLATAGSGDPVHTLHWTATPTQPQEVAFVEWNDLQPEPTDQPVPPVVVLDCRDGETGTDVLTRAHTISHRVLGVLQEFSTQQRFASSTLLVLTRAAVTTTAGDRVDPAASAVWGLVRSAQSEEPGRILLTDTDTDT